MANTKLPTIQKKRLILHKMERGGMPTTYGTQLKHYMGV